MLDIVSLSFSVEVPGEKALLGLRAASRDDKKRDQKTDHE
jgi:hypothetical protein